MAAWNEEDVEALLSGKGWLQSKHEIAHGVQFALDDGTFVNLYHTGRLVIQGKKSDRKREVEQLFDQQGRSNRGQSAEHPHASTSTPTRVFVVYGHDLQARDELELLLRRLKLEPIVLQNVAGGGDTIIEKLEELTTADFACVLVTPDDEGRKMGSTASDGLRPRARQNVVLELGMVLARLGRRRVAILVKGQGEELERPSDIDGLLYIPFNKDVMEAKNKLASSLQNAGFSIQIADLVS